MKLEYPVFEEVEEVQSLKIQYSLELLILEQQVYARNVKTFLYIQSHSERKLRLDGDKYYLSIQLMLNQTSST